MTKRIFLSLTLLLGSLSLLIAQTQTVRGVVTDKATKQPIVGATVVVSSITDQTLGAASGIDGSFEITGVPYGRHTFTSSSVGFTSFTTEGIIVSSTKSVYLEIQLVVGDLNLDEVVISASNNVNKPINELAVVSTRSFSADETDRIAASVNDPGRMAMAYPGVAQGSDDNENDIIVRGNSSFGVLWRLEGIDIPNPNHFARPGTSGGGITVFSAQLLSRSDFSTGGMPAEYGNALSGAFDVHFRKGNKIERQHRFKVGVLGIDVASEGPIKQNQSSYLANYRYSTLGLLTKNGIYLVGERVENIFQDLSFNLAFDGNSKNKFTVFGLGGLSREHYNPVENPTERDINDASHWEDRIRDGNVGVLGGTFTRLIDESSYFKAGLAVLGSEIEFYSDVLDNTNQRSNYYDERHNENRISGSFAYNKRINNTTRFLTGALFNYITDYEFYKRTVERSSVSDIIDDNVDLSVDGQGSTSYYQYYAQVSKDLSPKVTLNAGGHFTYLPLNNTTSLEPRLSFKFTPNQNHLIGLAYGLHSKILPFASYFYVERDTINNVVTERFPNEDLPFIKSHHLIGSYNYFTNSGLRFTTEVYYQSLFNVPAGLTDESFYWMLNNRSTFPQEDVGSDGTGSNVGVDIALEQFFSNRMYFLVTGSLFKSTFSPKNGEVYPSRFDNKFVSSLTLGREFELKKGRILQIGARTLLNGGNRYTPMDVSESLNQGKYVGDLTQFNQAQIPNYFRIDTRIAYRYNGERVSGNISLDIQNVLNRQNSNGVGYDANNNSLFLRYHTSGLVPVIAFQFDF